MWLNYFVCMEKKINLDIARQYYYINVPSSGHQAIFNSVFAYDALLKRLAEQQDIDLLGYSLFDDSVHLLLFSHSKPSQWLEPTLMQYNQWHQQASGQAGYLFNDEALQQMLIQPKFLARALKYIHQLPLRKKLCTQADQYLYSSFNDYLNGTTSMVKTERILTMLSPHNGQRIRRFHDYMLSSDHENLSTLESGNNEYYLAYSDSSYLTKARANYDGQIQEDNSAQHLELWQNCMLCLQAKTQLDEATLRGVRRHHALPDAHYLLAWLYVEEANGPIYFAAKQLQKDEDTLRLNIKSIYMHHPAGFLQSIREAWQNPAQYAQANNPAAPSVTEETVEEPVADLEAISEPTPAPE